MTTQEETACDNMKMRKGQQKEITKRPLCYVNNTLCQDGVTKMNVLTPLCMGLSLIDFFRQRSLVNTRFI